jgi:hypothetical protein
LSEQEPSPRDRDVLKALWALGSGSVRKVRRRMCPGGEPASNTVQTLLRIMGVNAPDPVRDTHRARSSKPGGP